MAFQFKSASCVAIGTFNIYIIQPPWLAHIGMLPDGAEVDIETNLSRPGFRLSSPSLGANWLVYPNRFAIETTAATCNCGETMAKVLEALPWTPLVAIGSNVLYEADSSELDALPDIGSYPSADVPGDYVLRQRSWHMGVRRDEHVFNLQLSVQEAAVKISSNVHTDLKNRDSKFAQQVAQRFFEHRAESVALIQRLFGARIEHDGGNS